MRSTTFVRSLQTCRWALKSSETAFHVWLFSDASGLGLYWPMFATIKFRLAVFSCKLRAISIAEKFIPEVKVTTKFVCPGNSRMLTVFNCTYKPLFRGFVKWQYGNSTDIDFETGSDFLKGPNDELLVLQLSSNVTFRCVGINFDDQSSVTLLAQYRVKVMDRKCYWWLNVTAYGVTGHGIQKMCGFAHGWS